MPRRAELRRLLAAVALAPACLPAACAGAEERPADPLPNVLLISIDTLRADHLASYGYARDTSPTLTALAARGAQFERSYAQAPSTVPTHASIFTGRLPGQHGAYGYRFPLSDRELTLAEHVGAHGYATFAVASSLRFAPDSGFAQGFEHYRVFDDLPRNERSRRVVREVLDRVEAERERPWFGFLHFFDVHAPYDPPAEYATRWHPGHSAFPPRSSLRFLKEGVDPARPMAPDVLSYLVGLYDGGISFLDSHLAHLEQRLRPRNGRSTLWIVTADHGEGLGEHGDFLHWGRHWEEMVRVPLLFSWPGRIEAGRRIARTAQSVDLFPTLVELLGLTPPPGLAGRSLARALLGGGAAADRAPEEAAGPRDVVVMQQEPGLWAVAATLEGARFKLIREATPPRDRLFRLDRDPGERRDLLPGAESVRDALAALVEAPAAGATPIRGVDPEVARRLRALGYAEEVGGLPAEPPGAAQ